MVTAALLGPTAGAAPGSTLYTVLSSGGPPPAAAGGPPASALAVFISSSYSRFGDVPFLIIASADASSASIFALNASNGCAPTNGLPLMKNDGVPRAPILLPSACSASTFCFH